MQEGACGTTDTYTRYRSIAKKGSAVGMDFVHAGAKVMGWRRKASRAGKMIPGTLKRNTY